MDNLNGIWCGMNATVAVIDEFYISFLRIKNDFIISILKHHEYGVVSVVYGMGIDFDAHALYCSKAPLTTGVYCNDISMKESIGKHSNDKFEYDTVNDKLIYTMYDGSKFELLLAEKIHMSDFNQIHPVDHTLPIAKRMTLWNISDLLLVLTKCLRQKLILRSTQSIFIFQ